MNMIRACIAVLGFVSVMFFSPLLTAACMVALSVRYRAFEVVALGAFADLLWLPYDGFLFSFPIATVISIILVWALEPLRLEFLR